MSANPTSGTRQLLILASAGLALGGGGCRGDGVPTSLVLSVVSAKGAPLPDSVQVRAFDAHGSWEAARFAVTGPGEAADDGTRLGTIVIYPRAGELALRLDARGIKADMPASEGAVGAMLSGGRQVSVRVVLAAAWLPDTDEDGVPDAIDNCPGHRNPNQEDGDADGRGDACTADGGATDAAADAGEAQERGKLPIAAPCSGPAQCESGFCFDGVCCESDCSQPCRVCHLAGKVGTCYLVADGEDPRGACTAEPASSCGLDGACDGRGACRKHRAGTVCRASSCATEVDRVLAGVCDGGGECLAGETRSCSPYGCAAGSCRFFCQNNNNDCAPGHWCSRGSCGLLPLGSPCAQKAQCDSDKCVDGVCCEVADCAGPCRACNVAGTAGLCRPIKNGDTAKAPGCMVEDPKTCGANGNCDGAGNCLKYPSGTGCGARACTDGTESSAPTCNGGGACLPGPARSCAPYTCETAPGTACRTACQSDADCTADSRCDGGKCLARKSNGDACKDPGECASNACVEGTCCTVPCPAGQFCAKGSACQPKRLQGTSCARASECQSGFCADDVCCDSACTETCKRCDVSVPAGQCQNTPAGQLDSYAAVACRAPHLCDGKGACP